MITRKEKQTPMNDTTPKQPETCSASMTLATIQAMDDDALNLAIDQQCTTHAWKRISVPNTGGMLLWELRDADGPGRIWSTVRHLHYTASWERTMGLRDTYCQYIDLVWAGPVRIVRTSYGSMPSIVCTTPEEERRAVCQLVLWQTLQRGAFDAREAEAYEHTAAAENRLTNGEGLP